MQLRKQYFLYYEQLKVLMMKFTETAVSALPLLTPYLVIYIFVVNVKITVLRHIKRINIHMGIQHENKPEQCHLRLFSSFDVRKR